MPTVRLTARKLAALKAEGQQRTEYFDQSLPSFGVRVSPTGHKTFFVVYRHGGRLRRLTLGACPPLTLADARDIAKDALREAVKGGDPAARKAAQRQAESFGELAREYLERYAKPGKKSWPEDERIINHDLIPVFGNMRAKDVARKDVRALLDRIKTTAPIMANRVRALLRKIYNWGIANEIVDSNPCHMVPIPSKEQKRQRVLSEDEIHAIWKALAAERPGTAATFRLRLLTAQRGGEVFSMEWTELDLESGWWTISPEKSKNGLAHRVPLSPQAIRILEEMKALPKRKSSRWVFPSPKGDTHIENVQKSIQRVRKETGIDFRGHDLRRTASSLMTGMGIARLTVSKILNHVEPGITAVYDRHSYDQEKRAALDAWGRRLQLIVSGLKEVAAEHAE